MREHRDPTTKARKSKAAAHASAGATFKLVPERWYEAQLGRCSRVNATKIAQALKRDVYPAIGALPLSDIDGPAVPALLRKVEKRGAIDTAKRIRKHISAVFGYGMAEGLCLADPAGKHLVKSQQLLRVAHHLSAHRKIVVIAGRKDELVNPAYDYRHCKTRPLLKMRYHGGDHLNNPISGSDSEKEEVYQTIARELTRQP